MKSCFKLLFHSLSRICYYRKLNLTAFSYKTNISLWKGLQLVNISDSITHQCCLHPLLQGPTLQTQSRCQGTSEDRCPLTKLQWKIHNGNTYQPFIEFLLIEFPESYIRLIQTGYDKPHIDGRDRMLKSHHMFNAWTP